MPLCDKPFFLMMINCKFFEAFGDWVGLDEFFQVFQFFGFYSFCRIVAGRYGLSQVQASSDGGDAVRNLLVYVKMFFRKFLK